MKRVIMKNNERIAPCEVDSLLSSWKWMAIAYVENEIDWIVMCENFESNEKSILCFNSFSSKNRRYNNTDLKYMSTNPHVTDILYFETLKEWFQYLADNL